MVLSVPSKISVNGHMVVESDSILQTRKLGSR